MNKNKQLIINMSAQVVAFLVNFGISFFLTPFVIANVGSEAYGFVGLANNFISYAQVITAALNSMAGRFITISIHQGRDEDTNKYMTSVIVANVCLSIPLTIVSVFILLFLPHLIRISDHILSDVTLLWALLFTNFIVGLLGAVFSTATFSQNRLELSSKRSIESNILKVIVLLIAFNVFKPSVWYIGLSTLICGIYVVVTNIRYTRMLLPSVRIRKRYIDFGKIKELVSAGIWNSVSKISTILYSGLDLLITNLFISSTAMGTVSIAKTLPSQILSVFGMLANVFMPQLTISYAKGNYKEIRSQIISAIKILGFIACVPISCLYVYGGDFFSLWVPEQDAFVLQLISIIACVEFPFVLPLEPLWNIFTVTNKIKQSSLVLLLSSGLSVIVMFLLLRGVQNEVLAMCIVVGVSCFIGVFRGITFLPIYGAKCLNFKWYTFYPPMIKNIIAIGLVTLVSFEVKRLIAISSWSTLIVCVTMTAIIACIFNFYILLGRDERKIIKSKLLKR